MANAMYESLVGEYTENYLQKVYYFCLKKTGNTAEAEDLSGDITLNVLTSLSRGSVPASFSAWVWQIARNRYSKWAAGKSKKLKRTESTDVDGFDLEDDYSFEETLENKLVYGCFPIAPLTAYSLLRVSEKVGQNERTIFTFLAQKEAGTLVEFLSKNSGFSLMTIECVFDYFKDLFKKSVFNLPIFQKELCSLIMHVNKQLFIKSIVTGFIEYFHEVN